MSTQETLKEIFQSVLDVDASTINLNSSTESIESWDSVHHIQLIMAIEAEFGLQFEPRP